MFDYSYFIDQKTDSIVYVFNQKKYNLEQAIEIYKKDELIKNDDIIYNSILYIKPTFIYNEYNERQNGYNIIKSDIDIMPKRYIKVIAVSSEIDIEKCL